MDKNLREEIATIVSVAVIQRMPNQYDFTNEILSSIIKRGKMIKNPHRNRPGFSTRENAFDEACQAWIKMLEDK